MKNSKYFNKVFVIYLAIILVFGLAIASILSFYFTNRNKTEIENTNQILMEMAQNDFDNKISIIHKIITKYKSDSDLIEFSRNPDDQLSILHLRNKLSLDSTLFSDLDYDLTILDTKKKFSINFNNTESLDEFLKRNETDEASVTQFLNTLNTASTPGILSIGYEENYSLLMACPFMIQPDNHIFLVATLRGNTILNTLTENDKEFMLLDHKNTPVLSNITQDTAEIQAQVTAHSNQDQFTMPGRTVYILPSYALSGYQYIYITPNDSWQWIFNIIIILFAVLLLILLATFFSYKLSSYIYRPIQNTLSDFEGYNTTLKNQDEFAFMRETLQKIRSARDALQTTLNENTNIVKRAFIRDLIYGTFDYNTAENDLIRYHISGDIPVSLVIIEFENWDEFNHKLERYEQETLKTHIFDIIDQMLKSKADCYIIELDVQRSAGIVYSDNTILLKQILLNIAYLVENDFGLILRAAIGVPAQSIIQINESFSSALSILDSSVYAPNKVVMTIDDIHQAHAQILFYPLDIEKNLLDQLLCAKKDKVYMILENIININFKNKPITKELLIEFQFAMASTIKRSLMKLNQTEETFFGEGTILYLELKQNDISTLEKRLKEIFDCIMETVKQLHNKAENNQTFQQIIEFIYANYQKDISLLDVAEEFNFSMSYVSRLFKTKLNINFKDFLSKHRIEIAKTVLETEKNIKISDLAQRVGYNNSATFIRAFKRYEGISPGEYLKNTESKI